MTTWFSARTLSVILHLAELSTIYTNHSIRATTITIIDRSRFEARHIMSVSGHRNESSVKTYSKTDANTKTNQARSLMAVIDNSKNHVVASEAGENDGNVELGLLTNSQEKFILRDLNVQTHNHCNQTTKQFIYLQPHSNISVNRFDFFLPRCLLNFSRRDFIYTFHQNLRGENNFSSQYIVVGCEICENKAHFLL